ncbi:unnamed protein product, partial [Symbiodinium sp. CCMP2456]
MATINVCRRGVSLHDQVGAFLWDHSVDIAVLPEADITAASCLPFCNAWRARGMHAALSPLENGVARVALVSKFPFRRVVLSRGEAATRHVAVVMDLKDASGTTTTVMVIGALQSGFKFVMLGDFNVEQTHPVLLDCALTGMIKPCDQCQPGLLPPTGARDDAPWAPFTAACQEGDLDEAWRLLSDWGETLLCDPDPGAVPRSSPWLPAVPRQTPTGKQPERSAGLRALLKLLSRLRAAVAQPHLESLWNRIAKSLAFTRRLVPELPRIDRADQDTVECVAALAQQYSDQERDAARRLWKRTTRHSLAAARTYVKSKADQILEWDRTLAEDRAPTNGRHPAIEVDRQAQDWMLKWASQCDGAEPGAQVSRILSEVPRPPATDVSFEITAIMLRTSLRGMQHKSCGPDGWDAQALLKLPTRWWDCAALLWNCVIAQSKVPEMWLRGRAALLWKPSGGTRPISVLPFIWRCGAKLLNQQLSQWTASWRSHFDSGGVAGTSIDTALQQLHRELQSGAQMAVQQDVSSFFDSLEYGLTARLLRHLRATECFVRLFENYCTRSSRIFALQGALSGDWVRPGRGLPQGCPLSPVIAAAVSHCWAAFVLRPQSARPATVTGHAYVDDRCLLLRAEAPHAHLRDALLRSDAFDRAFKLKLSLTKCAVVARADDAEASALARERQYKHLQTLEVLGVTVPLEEQWGLLRFSLDKVQLRLRLMRGLDLHLRDARQLLRELIVPAYAWAAPYAMPEPHELEAVRQETLFLCSRQVGQEAARVLFYEIAGWFLEPQFALDAAVLRATWRYVVRPPEWCEELPLSDARPPPPTVLPRLRQTLDRLRWWLTPDAGHLCCKGSLGETRQVHVGFESFRIVLRWLTAAYRMRYVLNTGRVWQYRAREADAACGLLCPVPPKDAHYEFAGHRTVFEEARGDRNLVLASFGAGCTNWFFNAKANFDPGHQRHLCMCGGTKPSRPHLVWCCSHTASLRQGIPPPQDRAAERLFARAVPLMPVPPSAVDPEGFREELCEQLLPLMATSTVAVATDGSSKHEVGAMCFALGSPDITCATADALEDQCSFRMAHRRQDLHPAEPADLDTTATAAADAFEDVPLNPSASDDRAAAIGSLLGMVENAAVASTEAEEAAAASSAAEGTRLEADR